MADYLEKVSHEAPIPYNREAVIKELEETVKWINEVCDGHGDCDWALAGLQVYFHKLERILDETGTYPR